MITLFKKIISVLILAIALSGITVGALEDFVIKPDGKFYEYSQNPEKVAEILEISEDELNELCKDSVLYIAVNDDNTKQIRITQSQNNFTYSIVNISNLTNDKIQSLLPQITGINGVKGEIINKNGQKFIKTVLRSEDSGGEYIITEYLTVADKKSYVLSFYTEVNQDTDFIEKTFNSFDSQIFLKENQKKNGIIKYVLPVLTVVFAAIAVVILITVLIDIRNKKSIAEETENTATEENE